jgi:hypothetical protein
MPRSKKKPREIPLDLKVWEPAVDALNELSVRDQLSVVTNLLFQVCIAAQNGDIMDAWAFLFHVMGQMPTHYREIAEELLEKQRAEALTRAECSPAIN